MSAAAVREGEVRTGQAKVAMRRDDGQMANWMDDGRGEATAATAYMDEVQVPAEGLRGLKRDDCL